MFDRAFPKQSHREHWLTMYLDLRDCGDSHSTAVDTIRGEMQMQSTKRGNSETIKTKDDKMKTEHKYILRQARRAISAGKFSLAKTYLDALPDCPEVASASEYLRGKIEERKNYEQMPQDEKEAFNNQ